jgi:hypothetical protein
MENKYEEFLKDWKETCEEIFEIIEDVGKDYKEVFEDLKKDEFFKNGLEYVKNKSNISEKDFEEFIYWWGNVVFLKALWLVKERLKKYKLEKSLTKAMEQINYILDNYNIPEIKTKIEN